MLKLITKFLIYKNKSLFSKTKSENKPLALLVDDFPILYKLMENKLSQTDFRIVRVKNYFEALHSAKREKIAILILNMDLPIFNCFDLGDLIRKRFPKKNQPIVLGYTQQFYPKEKITQSNVNDVIFLKNKDQNLCFSIKSWMNYI